MKYKLVENVEEFGAWCVQEIDEEDDTKTSLTVFYGARSKERAEAYMAWKHAVSHWSEFYAPASS